MDRTSRGSDAVEGSLAQVLARVAVRLQRIIQRSHLASLRYSHILRCIPAQMAPTYHTPGPSALFWLLLQPHLVLERPAQFFRLTLLPCGWVDLVPMLPDFLSGDDLGSPWLILWNAWTDPRTTPGWIISFLPSPVIIAFFRILPFVLLIRRVLTFPAFHIVSGSSYSPFQCARLQRTYTYPYLTAM